MNAPRLICKCRYCGRFLSPGLAVADFTPDTIYTYERIDFYHRDCWDKLGCIETPIPAQSTGVIE